MIPEARVLEVVWKRGLSGMARSLNVVIVTSELPWPATTGYRIRILNLALRLAPRHRITFIAYSSDEAEAAAVALGQHGIEALVVNRVIPVKSGPLFYARLVANLGSSLPYSVSSHSSEVLRRAVRSCRDRHRIDLWQAEGTALFGALGELNGACKVIMAHNVESLIWQRHLESETHPLKRWYIKQQQHKFERFERHALAAANRVVVVSAQDASLVRERFGVRRVDVVDNGIDRAYFGAVQAEREPRQILFLGSLDWRPNLDAVGLLLDRIFPAVQASEPLARLCLVGRKPPDSLVRRIQGLENVELHADVPDVRPYLARSGVMVVPLRIGGGSRLKILESLAAGLPVVSTRIGAEGLDLEPGRDFMQGDTVDEIVRALIDCIRRPGSAQAQAERVRRYVLDRYDWDRLASQLESVWLDCADTLNRTSPEVRPR